MKTPRKRLCIVSPRQYGGGAEYQIHCLIDVLERTDRYEIFYLARHVIEQSAPANYRLVRIGKKNLMPRFGYIMDAVPLYKALRDIAPEVIYQRVACGYTGISAFYAQRRKARLIWHIAHDSDVMRVRGGGRNPLRSIIEKGAIEYAVRRADHVVVQKEHQASLLLQNYGREADAVIPNFQPAPTETIDKSGPTTVVWVANMKPWKQPDVFVRLAAALRDLPNVRFVMVGAAATGSGDREWYEALLGQIRAAPNVDYVGEKTQAEVNQLFAQAHVFVNTSYLEGFPNTFIQAWMRELPVVSVHVNPDDVLDVERVGMHARTEEGLLGAVRMLVTDERQRSEYGKRARAYAMRKHSVDNAGQLAQLIETGEIDGANATFKTKNA